MLRRLFVVCCFVLLCVAVSAQQASLLISEVLFNPVDDGVDYVELYNAGTMSLNLNDYYLARLKEDSITKIYSVSDGNIVMMEPGAYYVITTSASDIVSRYTVVNPSHIIEVPSMPSYNNASGVVMLTTEYKDVVDRLDYDESMHSPLLRSVEGVALERRSFQRPTQERSNWFSASSTSGYGTPTSANSQSKELVFREDAFSFFADSFSPDGDGVDDLMDIGYQFSDASLAANVAVFDAEGRKVRNLLQGALLGASGVISWNGLDNKGNRCRQGNYIFFFEIYNTEGKRQNMKKVVTLLLATH